MFLRKNAPKHPLFNNVKKLQDWCFGASLKQGVFFNCSNQVSILKRKTCSTNEERFFTLKIYFWLAATRFSFWCINLFALPSPHCRRTQVQLKFLCNFKTKLATLWLAKCEWVQTMAWKRIERPLLWSSWDKDNVKRVGDPSHEQLSLVLGVIVFLVVLNISMNFPCLSVSIHAGETLQCKCQSTGRDKIKTFEWANSEQVLVLFPPQWKVATPLAQLTNHLNKSLLTDLRVPGRLGTREKEFIESELTTFS